MRHVYVHRKLLEDILEKGSVEVLHDDYGPITIHLRKPVVEIVEPIEFNIPPEAHD